MVHYPFGSGSICNTPKVGGPRERCSYDQQRQARSHSGCLTERCRVDRRHDDQRVLSRSVVESGIPRRRTTHYAGRSDVATVCHLRAALPVDLHHPPTRRPRPCGFRRTEPNSQNRKRTPSIVCSRKPWARMRRRRSWMSTNSSTRRIPNSLVSTSLCLAFVRTSVATGWAWSAR